MVINKGYTSFPVNPKNYINPDTGSFKSGMSAGTSSMMFGIGESIIKAQNTYGANAMNIFSNAIRESATGTSSIAFYKNNLFGMGAVWMVCFAGHDVLVVSRTASGRRLWTLAFHAVCCRHLSDHGDARAHRRQTKNLAALIRVRPFSLLIYRG